MAKRRLPIPAAIALDILATLGARELGRNEFELLMHQRGCSGRAAGEALRALGRRGWYEDTGGTLRFAEEAFAAGVVEPVKKKSTLPKRLKRRSVMAMF